MAGTREKPLRPLTNSVRGHRVLQHIGSIADTIILIVEVQVDTTGTRIIFFYPPASRGQRQSKGPAFNNTANPPAYTHPPANTRPKRSAPLLTPADDMTAGETAKEVI